MHIPVLLNESIAGLSIIEGGIYVDCTTNRAGHSIEIAKRIGKSGTLVCIDLDQTALKEAKEKLEALPEHPKYYFISRNFRHIRSILDDLKIKEADGVLADLGLSSEELDVSGRGFTFRYDEPLLMTFESQIDENILTAKDIVNNWQEETLSDIFFGYADESYSRRIAKAITKYRKEKSIETTFQLVEIIRSAVPASYTHRHTHFATKVFQALRMAVNDEINSIEDLLHNLPNVLRKSGKACIITFHSTEDRTVKQTIKAEKLLLMINKKAIMPTREEEKLNPRARSAQLRIAERI
jgi:16S rRNA (cytosine1402-N4)-methyltransferase